MGIFDKIKKVAKGAREIGPDEQKRREQSRRQQEIQIFEKKQLKLQERESYQEGLRRGTLERARREGYKKGRAGSGLSANVGSIIKGIGEVGKGAERSLNVMFGETPFSTPRRPKLKASGKHHKKKKQATRGLNWYEL